MDITEIHWVSDAGHAWLAVPLDRDAYAASTGYGYVDLDDQIAYLEEDCEAGAYIRETGLDLDTVRYAPVIRHDGYAPLRNLPHLPEVH